MNRSDYIVIQAPMVTDLKLSGNKLIVYALIHGFCKDGKHEFIGSINYICEWTNLTRNTVISTLKALVLEGLLLKREYEVNNVKCCAYSLGGSAKIAPVVQNLQNGGAENDDCGSAKNAPNNNTTTKERKENNNDNISIVESDDTFVERMYKLYPSKCPIRGVFLGKSSQDKTRIRQLMKRYSREDIERVIGLEVKNKYGKSSMRNFSTFLNNFPDPAEICENSNPRQGNLFSQQSLPLGMIINESAEERNKKYEESKGW